MSLTEEKLIAMGSSEKIDKIEGLKDFQKQRSFSGDSGPTISMRERALSFTKVVGRKISPPESRERCHTFSQLKSSMYLDRVKQRRETNKTCTPLDEETPQFNQMTAVQRQLS